MKMKQIIRIDEVMKKTTISKTTIYEMIKRKEFPDQIKIGLRATGWLESEIEEWIDEKIKERDKKAA